MIFISFISSPVMLNLSSVTLYERNNFDLSCIYAILIVSPAFTFFFFFKLKIFVWIIMYITKQLDKLCVYPILSVFFPSTTSIVSAML